MKDHGRYDTPMLVHVLSHFDITFLLTPGWSKAVPVICPHEELDVYSIKTATYWWILKQQQWLRGGFQRHEFKIYE